MTDSITPATKEDVATLLDKLSDMDTKLDNVLEFINMMTAGARKAMTSPGLQGAAARAMIPPHLQQAAMNGHAGGHVDMVPPTGD